MHIGILGSGLMGGKLGTIFARAGHDVDFSYSRSRQMLADLAGEAAPNLGPVPDKLILTRSLPTSNDDSRFHPVDPGPLSMARYAEPVSPPMAQLADNVASGPRLTYRFTRHSS